MLTFHPCLHHFFVFSTINEAPGHDQCPSNSSVPFGVQKTEKRLLRYLVLPSRESRSTVWYKDAKSFTGAISRLFLLWFNGADNTPYSSQFNCLIAILFAFNFAWSREEFGKTCSPRVLSRIQQKRTSKRAGNDKEKMQDRREGGEQRYLNRLRRRCTVA